MGAHHTTFIHFTSHKKHCKNHHYFNYQMTSTEHSKRKRGALGDLTNASSKTESIVTNKQPRTGVVQTAPIQSNETTESKNKIKEEKIKMLLILMHHLKMILKNVLN